MSNKIKWFARILSVLVLLFGLPFYFGYGNPIPFIDPTYTFFDNLWPTIFPVMFIGLILGWKYPKIGGGLILASLGVGFIYRYLLKKTSHHSC